MPDQRELATAAVLALPRFVGSTVQFHNAVADRLGVTPTELHCLHLIHGGVSDSPSELAGLLGMSTGAFTRLLDRMEQHGLARRCPDSADRRRVVIRPLPDRMAELAELFEPLARFFSERFAGLDRRQLTALVEFLTDGSAAAESARTQAGDVTRAISN